MQKIYQALLEKQAELSDRLNKKDSDNSSIESEISDENMRGTIQEDAERKSIGLKWIRDRLREVQQALQKFEDGTFGICEDCEKDIPIKRLEAYPNATLCIECKEKQEKENKK